MSRVREVTPKVLEILKQYPETRSDDNLLLIKVYQIFYEVNPGEPFGSVLRRSGLPKFETVRRARQKIQAYCPEYRAEEPIESMRIEKQREFIEYSQEPV